MHLLQERNRRVAAIANRLTETIVRRPKLLLCFGVFLVLLSIAIIAVRHNLDSEVLNLLPQNFASVQGLKEFNENFSNSRQLVIGFLGETGHADDVDAFKSRFMEELGRQPWVLRTFYRIPLDSPEGLAEIQAVVPALLLNLPGGEFREALQLLDPGAIQDRLDHIRDTLGAISPLTEVNANVDPLGLFARAMKPFAGDNSTTSSTSFGSEDGLYQLAFMVTRQVKLGAPQCQLLMQDLNAFIEHFKAGYPGYKPQVYVTGRIAFVAQISKSMENDALLSALFSMLIVGALFYLAFRRFLPLLGISVLLLVAALMALAFGMLVLKSLNVVAIGFFSILVGLGVDFSLLLYGRYQQARRSDATYQEAVFVSVRDVGAAVFYVVCTTAIGFFALNLSKSAGFSQLGTLVATGVAFAGLLMVLFLFPFLRPVQVPKGRDVMLSGANGYVDFLFRRPFPVLLAAGLILVTAAILALTPIVPLNFDTNPTSLQPKDIPASVALRVLSQKIKQESDPIDILVKAGNATEFHDRWQKISDRLSRARSEGEIKYASTPLPLALSPAQVEANRQALRQVNFPEVIAAVRTGLERNGFDADAFQYLFELLEKLKSEQSRNGLPDISHLFPENSSWWFLIDRFFSSEPNFGVGYTQTVQPIRSEGEQQKIAQLIHEADPEAIVTGWQFTLWDLIPWARGELISFTAIVGLLIITLLWIVYRRLSLWLLHVSALLLSMLALVALLKLMHVAINLLNTLAFPLVLAIGVDYGIQFLVVSRREGDLRENLANVLKPLLVCGLAMFSGFAVLIPAQNPALSGLGTVCSLGVLCCMITTYFFMVPFFAWLQRRPSQQVPRSK